jgi:hypothetical protein
MIAGGWFLAPLFVLAAADVPAPDAGAVAARPLELDRPITEADLAGRTLRELAIMRSYPLARAGGAMPARWLQDYFSKNGRPWYKRSKAPAELKPLDQQNIVAIDKHLSALPKAELEARYRALMVHEYGGGDGGPLAFSPDGRRLASAFGGGVATWDVGSGRRLRTFEFRVPDLLGFSADGRQLLVFMGNGCRFFDSATGKRLGGGAFGAELGKGVLTNDRRRVLVWLGDPDADGNDDDLKEFPITLLDLGSMKTHDLWMRGEVLLAAAASPDDKTAVALSERGAFYTFDLATYQVVAKRQPKSPIDSRNANLSSDGRFAVIPWPAGSLTVLDGTDPDRRTRLTPLPEDGLQEGIASLDGRSAIAVSGRGALLQYDLGIPGRPRTLRGASRPLAEKQPAAETRSSHSLTLSADGKRLAFSDGNTWTVSIWDLETGSPLSTWANHVPFRSPEDAIELLLLAQTLRRPIPPSVQSLGKAPR